MIDQDIRRKSRGCTVVVALVLAGATWLVAWGLWQCGAALGGAW